MEKSKLNISVGLLGFILCFSTFFGSYIPAILIGGYILLREENAWIRTLAVRVLALLVIFGVASTVIYLIPDCLGVVSKLVAIFNTDGFTIGFINRICSFLSAVLSFAKTLVFLALGLTALKGSTIKLPIVDGIVNKNL